MSGNLHTIAFYNLENLFDTEDDPKTLDDDFTAGGFKKWSGERYLKKLYKLARTISGLGLDSAMDVPELVGVAEVENAGVLRDLLAAEPLKETAYAYVHFDSPDERGKDTALIYNREHFEVIYAEPITLAVYNPDGVRDTTRDILYVRGKLNGEELQIFVNHWPSRRDGAIETEYKRLKAARTIQDYMHTIENEIEDPGYIIMGDCNDGPASESVQLLVRSKGLYNPMEKLLTPDRGSASYGHAWALFDQIMISGCFLDIEKGTHSFAHANIFDERFLQEYSGEYAGTPFRTFSGRKYLGGYSDHFPVYIQLKYHP